MKLKRLIPNTKLMLVDPGRCIKKGAPPACAVQQIAHDHYIRSVHTILRDILQFFLLLSVLIECKLFFHNLVLIQLRSFYGIT